MELTGPPSTIRNAKRLRRELSLPEVLLWQQLRRRPAGLKFRRQHPAGRYVLDFYCDAVHLAIEVDSEAHNRGDRPARDVRRDAWIARQGVRTLRIPAKAILTDLESAIRHIIDVARTRKPDFSPAGGGGPPQAGEEADAPASVLPPAPSTTRYAGGPPPPVGKDLR